MTLASRAVFRFNSAPTFTLISDMTLIKWRKLSVPEHSQQENILGNIILCQNENTSNHNISTNI